MEDPESDGSEESCGRIVESAEVAVARLGQQQNNKSIFCRLKIKGEDSSKFNARIQLATDTGVRKTILCRSDWEKIKGESHLVRTKLKFRPYGTQIRLPIKGRAKVQLKARAGAVITTYVYINDDENDSSLLGEKDAKRLGIVKINLRGSNKEVLKGEELQEDTEVISNRIRQTGCPS